MAKRHVNAVNQIDERIDLQRNAWLVTEAVLLAMNASLREIGSRRNRQIKKQHHTIIANRAELLRLLQLNSELENRVERASRLAALESEQFLHRVGADLHDGPAQLIGFALLHLSSLAPCLGEPDKVGEAMAIIAGIHGALADAMDEVRSLCAGLTMPASPCSRLPTRSAASSKSTSRGPVLSYAATSPSCRPTRHTSSRRAYVAWCRRGSTTPIDTPADRANP